MIRNLKVLGLALVAVFAMSAVVASAASADVFHSEIENTVLTGKSIENQVFEYEAGGEEVTCTTATFNGEIKGKTTTNEVTVHPTYSNCSDNILFTAVTVNTTGCNYNFTITEAATSGATHVECETGKSIAITVKLFGATLCTLRVGSQTPAGEADYANEGSGTSRAITVQPTQTGIVGTREGSSECGGATSSEGTYHGKGTVTGETSAGVQKGIFVQ